MKMNSQVLKKSSQINQQPDRKEHHKKANSTWNQIKGSKQLYIMALPAMILLFMFSYLPMFGLLIAFKQFDFSKGILGSPWMKPFYANFKILFQHNSQALFAIRNTLFLNFLFIIIGTIFALFITLLFNEIKNKSFKRITQSITFLPYFISMVVVGIFVTSLFSFDTGIINHLLTLVGLKRINFYMSPQYWPSILVIVTIWKGAGYSAVVYLATISGIDPSYYEAAEIDGATRWGQMRYISLPLLMPTVIILTLLAVGRIMNADFGLFYNVIGDMPTLYKTTDVLDTYIFRALRQTGDIGISSATGFFQSVVSFVMVLVCNKLANKYDKESSLF
ncbi:MAG TPA: ABC transporter permease subunit [Ruminiclostridium sp.]